MSVESTVVRVRPRALEWIALALFPLAAFFAANILLGMIFGMPQKPDDPAWAIHWQRMLVVGSLGSVCLIGANVWVLLSRGFWTLDDRGITRGKIAMLQIPWSDVESAVKGTPDALPSSVELLAAIPTEPIQWAVSAQIAYRQAAIVLRLSGKRLFVVSLFGRQHVGGPLFMQALLERCAPKLAPPSTYTRAEKKALDRRRFTKILTLPTEG